MGSDWMVDCKIPKGNMMASMLKRNEGGESSNSVSTFTLDTSHPDRSQDHCRKVSREVLGMTGDIECSLEPLADGFNFMSDAFFVKVNNESEEKSLFVKVPPKSNELKLQLFQTLPEDFNMFQREFYFYNSVQNLFKIVIEDQEEDVEDILSFIPRPITLPGKLSFNRGLEEPITLEDLSSSGYRMWKDEFNGLDLVHAGACLDTYGKLHALGLVLFEKKIVDENTVKLMDYDLMKIFTDPINNLVDKGMEAFIQWMETNEYRKDSITKLKYQLTERNYLKTVAELIKEGKTHELQTIHHGDARCNNILFKYASDNTTPTEVKMVDFQSSIFFNPFFDLVYLLAISVSANVLIPNYQNLLSRYQSSLVSTLSRLNYNKTKPSVSYISKYITHFAPMVLPHICLVINISVEGNPDLDPALRGKKFRSAVEVCHFLGII